MGTDTATTEDHFVPAPWYGGFGPAVVEQAISQMVAMTAVEGLLLAIYLGTATLWWWLRRVSRF